MRWLAVALTLLLAIAPSAQGQTPAATQPNAVATLEEVVNELIRAARQTIDQLKEKGLSTKFPFSGTVSDTAGGAILTYLAGQVVEKEAYNRLTALLTASNAVQIGSTSDSGGSTSVAMKGLVPAILGFAVEHGAITRDVNETVVTFRVSPAGVVKALQGKGLLDIYEAYTDSAAYRFASRFSGAASFDTNLGGSPGTLLANQQQLTAWSVTVMVWNTRDPRAKAYATQWRQLATAQGPELIKTRAQLDAALKQWLGFTTWQTALQDRVRREVDEPWATDGDVRAATARFKSILEAELPALAELPSPSAPVTEAMSAYVVRLSEVVKARNDIYAYANEGAIATFDWTTTRDEKLPDLFTLTAVYENSFTPSRKDDFTTNVALRFYREAPIGADRRLKDFSVSAQWDRPLGSVFEIPFVFSAATKYQFIPEEIPVPAAALIVPETIDGVDTDATGIETTDAGSAIAPKGHLILGQAKLTIPLKNGVRIPLSLTFANRTELIEENDVRANFGVTFDLDAFVAAFKAR